MKLERDTRIADPDGLYDRLIELHRDLTPEQSHAVNARLILLLANHIGDRTVIEEAIARARSPAAS